MSEQSLKAIVLAAGKGTRMRTDGVELPKVMRRALGEPLLKYVLDALDFIAPEDTVIVVGYMRETVTAAFPGCAFAEQAEQLGTGHAVASALPVLEGFEGSLLVCCGDMPLIRRETYEALWNEHRRGGYACTMLTGSSDVPLPYGRVKRGADGGFERIVEEKDATAAERAITELNSGVYIFEAPALRDALAGLRRDNAQGEYYLTDVPAIMRERGLPIGICRRELGREIIGVNTPEQLKIVEDVLRAQ